MFKCTKCKEFKLAECFAKDNKKINKLTSHCKNCRNKARKEYSIKNNGYDIEKSKEYRQNNVEKVKASNRNTKLKKAYGINQEQFLEMSKEQNNKCACCNKEKKLVVDHCHVSGKIRELLCGPCNTSLGLLNEDINILQNLIKYIRKHNG